MSVMDRAVAPALRRPDVVVSFACEIEGPHR